MNFAKVLRFGLFSIVLSLSCRVSKPVFDLSMGQQAYDKGDYPAALKEFLPLARQGDPVAQNYIGIMYENGNGVAQDYKESVKWYRMSTEKGYSFAQYNLGRNYENGNGVAQNFKEAVKWYHLAGRAGQGLADAQQALGRMFYYGNGVAQDYEEAAKWYRIAAGQGYAPAQAAFGFLHERGEGVPQDYEESVKWYRLAAEQGDPMAQVKLGFDYNIGQGVPQDYQEAAKWYRMAADQGNAVAQNNLGVDYELGQGVSKDKVRAHMWYNLSAAKGYAEGLNNRNRIEPELTSVQLAEAQRLALEWTSSTEMFAKYGARPATVEELRRALPGGSAVIELRHAPPRSSAVIDHGASAKKAGGTSTSAIPPPPPGYTLEVPPLAPAQSIEDAEDKGFIHTSYRSLDGASSGDSVILIVVRISGPSRLALSIPSGLALSSPSQSSQSMVISALQGRDLGGGKYTPENLITLTDNKPVRYVIAAYCAEFHKDNPPPDKFDFQVAAKPDPVLACVLNGARKEKLSVAGTQAAVWIRTDHVTFPEMNKRMTVDWDDWSRAESVASRCNHNQ